MYNMDQIEDYVVAFSEHYDVNKNSVGIRDVGLVKRDYLNTTNICGYELDSDIASFTKMLDDVYDNNLFLENETKNKPLLKGIITYRTNEINARVQHLYQKYITNIDNGIAFLDLLETAAVNYLQDSKHIELQAYSDNQKAILEQAADGKDLKATCESIFAEVHNKNKIIMNFHMVAEQLVQSLSTMNLKQLYELNVSREIDKRVFGRSEVKNSKKVKK